MSKIGRPWSVFEDKVLEIVEYDYGVPYDTAKDLVMSAKEEGLLGEDADAKEIAGEIVDKWLDSRA